MTWLTRTPSGIVQALAKMLLRLEGEDAIRLMNITALATGNIEEAGARRLTGLFTAMSEGRPVTDAGAKDPARVVTNRGIKVNLIPTTKPRRTPVRKEDGTGTHRPRRS